MPEPQTVERTVVRFPRFSFCPTVRMGAADYKFHSEEMKRSLLGAILCLLTVMLHVAAVSGKVATVYKGGIEWSVNTVSKTAVAVGPSDKTYGSLTNPVIPDSVLSQALVLPASHRSSLYPVPSRFPKRWYISGKVLSKIAPSSPVRWLFPIMLRVSTMRHSSIVRV